MKALVFGFSVTAETDGFVERWRSEFGQMQGLLEVAKVGIGGLQPYIIRHFFGTILDREAPTFVVIEIASAITRKVEGTDVVVFDHTRTLLAIFNECCSRGIRCGILDLPLIGLDPTKDWMSDLHAMQCARFNVAHFRADLDPTALKDVVHPNEKGKILYAGALQKLFEKMLAATPDFAHLEPVNEFGAFPIESLMTTGGIERNFERAGFVAKAVSVDENQTISISLPRIVVVSGVLALMGPRSGMMEVTTGARSTIIRCYDSHCYYERVGGMRITPTECDFLLIKQLPGIPSDIQLQKGERNDGHRIGAITHVLYESRRGTSL